MTEPTTVNRALIVPNTGDLPDTWGTDAINPDMVAIDGMFGGATTIPVTSGGSVTLSVPSGFVATPSAGPTETQNAYLIFTGTLTGNAQVVFPTPGFYIVDNRCTVGAYYVQLTAPGAARVIGAPPGQAVHVFCDGTNMYYVNLPPVGSYIDIGASAVPAWITNCTVPPYLNCDGSTFSSVTYPNLAALLGGTTLPDTRGRARFSLNQSSGRLSLSGGTGIDGDTILAGGGSQTFVRSNMFVADLTVSIASGQGAHTHPPGSGGAGFIVDTSGTYNLALGSEVHFKSVPQDGSSTLPALSGTAATGGSATPLLPPGYIGGLTLIRAG